MLRGFALAEFQLLQPQTEGLFPELLSAFLQAKQSTAAGSEAEGLLDGSPILVSCGDRLSVCVAGNCIVK